MSFISKEWMDAFQEELFGFLLKYQPKLVSGVNIKTINNASILGSGNITIESGGGGSGGSEDTYKATVTVTELLADSLTSSVIDKIVALRTNVGGNDSVILPYDNNSGTTTTYVPAVITENGSSFKMVFYFGDSYYIVTGDASNNYAVSRQEFLTSGSLTPSVSYFIETEEPGIFLVDQAGNIALSYTSSGLDVAEISTHLMTAISDGVSDLEYDVVSDS
ncbi:hypothetical protein [Prevotella sp. E2-28]|uniref:hypothetical protein n=1 Tax=Prevotella sp. E2-28 TaxID=2913620 RepID=UPI001EDBD52F|nr:hypothetical protein [Prevotella sp. E2-28]UKK52655.1 hypothetical protein L6465_08555 [Prevotella sp. E2-28]